MVNERIVCKGLALFMNDDNTNHVLINNTKGRSLFLQSCILPLTVHDIVWEQVRCSVLRIFRKKTSWGNPVRLRFL